MTNYEIAEQHREKLLLMIERDLAKVSQLIAFIQVYGSMWDNNYNAYILNLHNISEQYLKNFISTTIDSLYDTFVILKQENKSSKEIYEELRLKMQKLPAYSVLETSDRQNRKR